MSGSNQQMRRRIDNGIQEDRTIIYKSAETQLLHLIIKPLHDTVAKPSPRILVIDALDECDGDEDQCLILKLIGRLVDDEDCNVRCLLTSRPEPQIMAAIASLQTTVTHITLNEATWDANEDIRTYLRSRFDEISTRLPPSIPRPWPSDNIIEKLVKKAGGIFIYASTVLRYIEARDALPTNRLKDILNLSAGSTPFAQLDLLYQQILSDCPMIYRGKLLHILGFLILCKPQWGGVTIGVVEEILGLDAGEVMMILRKAHSILKINVIYMTVTFLHTSFRDFIFNRARSGSFFIDQQEESLFLALQCINYLGHCPERCVKLLILGLHQQLIFHQYGRQRHPHICMGILGISC
jgi:hypothetical protein